MSQLNAEMDSLSITFSNDSDTELLSPTLSTVDRPVLHQRSGATTSTTVEIPNEIEVNDDSSLDDNSVASGDFFGRNIIDLFPEEDESEWFHYLNEFDRLQLQRGDATKVQPEHWGERLISDMGEDCELLLDSSKKEAMESCILETQHIERRLKALLKKNYDDNVSIYEIIDLALGPKSDFFIAISETLELNHLQFMQFFGTLCLQMSYKETFEGLFDSESSITHQILLTKEEYMDVWKKFGTMKKVSNKNYVGSSRREKCLWQILEVAVNSFLRSISIVGRNDDIPVALDDDKIWVHVSGKNDEDHFGLRKVTHVKDNGKGIISHTAIFLSTIMPLAFMFERKGNNAVDCFSKLFSDMFPANEFGKNLPDLNRVTVHSDRGYTLESTIFQFLIPSGANFTNTVKRVSPFPFLWGMKPRREETRTILTENGCPALYVKEIMSSGKKVSCFAFRTGTSNISAVLSSTIEGHQWEGVCLSHKQRIKWERDQQHGLDAYLFPALATDEALFERHSDGCKTLFNRLQNDKIDVLTLEQGTADWHKGRQFSFTSSQADGSFRMAMILFQDKLAWCNVAEYLEGAEYHNRK